MTYATTPTNSRAALALTPVALVLALALLASDTYAGPDAEGGKRRGPPAVAIDACEGLAEGDACSFTGRRGDEIQGQCFIPLRNDSIIVCAPEGRRGPRSEPPAEPTDTEQE